ncbi:MAG: hypothetical protein QOD89_996 [Bradyrhizobium sp.]|jgi:hypothetical protein|nr:hypothetical protein [Bradyrhizobium sp.]
MTKPAETETPKAEPPQPAAPAQPALRGFGEGLESPRSVHC